MEYCRNSIWLCHQDSSPFFLSRNKGNLLHFDDCFGWRKHILLNPHGCGTGRPAEREWYLLCMALVWALPLCPTWCFSWPRWDGRWRSSGSAHFLSMPYLAVQPGNPVLTLLGDAPDSAIRGHTAPEVGRSSPSVVGSSWAKLLCSAISSQQMPNPVLTTASFLCSTAVTCVFQSHLEVLPRLARERKYGLDLTDLSLSLPYLWTGKQKKQRKPRWPSCPPSSSYWRNWAVAWQCHKCPSCLHSVPRHFSSPESGASHTTFHFFPLAQVATLHTSSLERLDKG